MKLDALLLALALIISFLASFLISFLFDWWTGLLSLAGLGLLIKYETQVKGSHHR